ncbi:GL16664 [Drosophila persimilis]|uniref:GL16664 n=1 Tax=Drosophila persimilis TaxID=7234 RepID=B4HC73_DROPE|nr:GL16664 [Drosophila persimilis]
MADESQENDVPHQGLHAPTSEVGSASPPDHSDKYWRTLLEAQNRNFMELIKSMQASKNSEEKAKVVTLPKYNADAVGADSAAWCKTVYIIMAEDPLEGSALVMALSDSLEGGASQWLSQICYTGIKWPAFRDLFVQR